MTSGSRQSIWCVVANSPRRLAAAAELADDGAVQLHLVDLAGELGRRRRGAVGPRVRDVEVLLARVLRPRPTRDAHRPRVADVGVVGLPVQVVVQHLHALVAPVAHVDVALEVGGDRVRRVELQVAVAARADGLHEPAVLVVLHDARVEVAVRHEDVALLVEGHVGLAAEPVFLVPAVVDAGARHVRQRPDRILPPADGHQHAAVGRELHQHVRAFVHRPDVVLRVHPHRVREGEAVVVPADLADEGALRRVLEESRLVGAVEDVDVALRVGGDAHVLAGVDAGRVLEEPGHGLVRNHRDIGGRGLVLRGDGRAVRHRPTSAHTASATPRQRFMAAPPRIDRHFITHAGFGLRLQVSGLQPGLWPSRPR